MTTPIGGNLYIQGGGSRPEDVEIPHYDTRNPSSTDVNFPLGKRWINTSTSSEFSLCSFSPSLGTISATWTPLGGGGTAIATLTGNSGGPVAPSGGNINILGDNSTGITVSGDAGASTLTIQGIQGTTTQLGVLNLATNAETIAGTSTTKATTPDDIKSKLGTQTTHGLPIGAGASSALTWTAAPTNGQLLIGSTAANPVLNSLTAGSGITITPGAGSITIAASGGGSASLSPYIVGTTGTSDYSTIQAAITAAVGDGASLTNQKNIYIKPGTYTENITGASGINLIGFNESPCINFPGFRNNANFNTNSVVIAGTVTLDTSAIANQARMYISNITIAPASGTAISVIGQAGFDQGIIFTNSTIRNVDATGVFINFNNSSIYLNNCLLDDQSTATTFTVTAGSQATFSAFLTTLTGSRVSGQAVTINDGQLVTMVMAYSSWEGVVTASSGTLNFTAKHSTHRVDPGTQISPVYTNSGAAFNIIYYFCDITCSSSWFFIDKLFITDTCVVSQCFLDGLNPSSINSDFLSPTVWKFSGNTQTNAKDGHYGTNLKVIDTYPKSEQITTQNAVDTSDNTPTTLATITVNEGESVTLSGTITGTQSDFSNAVGGNFLATARRASGGNVTLANTVVCNVISSSAATFTVDVNGASSLRIQVTGIAATGYSWVTTYSYQKVTHATN